MHGVLSFFPDGRIIYIRSKGYYLSPANSRTPLKSPQRYG
jgi:hypothetical protein